MKTIQLEPTQSPLMGTLHVPGDKSISHRAVMFGSLADGKTTISNFLTGADCLSTVNAFRSMGIPIEQKGNDIRIHGKGLRGLKEPVSPIDLGNSGTTTRLLIGILAGQPGYFVLTGDESLSARPMNRVTNPLREMGASIDGRDKGNLLPLTVRGAMLHPIRYTLPVNSAQVKSAVLLGGLYTNGITKVIEPVPTRDHTERMLKAFGVNVERHDHSIILQGGQALQATSIEVPGDISSAAFFISAAAMIPESKVTIKDVGLNPTRTGIIDIVQKMGGSIQTNITRHIGDEPVGEVTIMGSELSGTDISGKDIPRLIDEIPIIALMASQANGKTVIRDAEELRFKETDRIKAVIDTLKQMGVSIEGTEDGMIIYGKGKLKGGTFTSYKDHRMGMMIAIASLMATSPIVIEDTDCIGISYPNFFEDLATL